MLRLFPLLAAALLPLEGFLAHEVRLRTWFGAPPNVFLSSLHEHGTRGNTEPQPAWG